eukprot:TRINITY_DN70112_c0_g1_i1.p1 TRINITY_DN70112_c0_g1~~TRINITY_DN70112_c0_g1_i1.p1  ORF type:complete len:341 (+),score=106.43 TRINITY_DN70112_c0_g1_i1:87-1109(+)
MGRGARHSRSCQIKPYLTYDERNCRTGAYHGRGVIKIALDVNSGTMVERVGSDSQKDFDACWLCNSRAQSPVVTPEGMLYCKECILQYMATHKQEYKRQLAAYQAQQEKLARRAGAAASVRSAIEEEAARAGEDRLLPARGADVAREAEERACKLERAVAMEGKKEQSANSFWTAQNTPQWDEVQLAEPDPQVRCPFSKKPLKLKRLVDVQWTEQREALELEVQADSETGRYMCPVCNITFRRGSDIVILPNGQALAKKAFERVCGKVGQGAAVPQDKAAAAEKELAAYFRCPVTGDMLKRSGVISLVRGATAFAASVQDQAVGASESTKYRPSLTMAVS